MFETELSYFKSNQEALVASHYGMTLALQGESVIGVYATPLDAYLDLEHKGLLGSVMIQRCIPGPDAYTVTITSSLLLV